MKLFGYYRSSASYRIRIVLNYKNMDWDYQPVLLNRDEHRDAAFRARNPIGFVPVLETAGMTVSQSTAIAELIEQEYPEPPLLPAGAAARAEVREMMGIIGCDIHPLQNLRVLKHLRAEFGQDDEGVAAWCRRWIHEGFGAFEILAGQRSTHGRYCCGDTATLADAWLIPQVYNARRFALDLAPFPHIRSIHAHCSQLQPFAEAEPERQLDAPQMQPDD